MKRIAWVFNSWMFWGALFGYPIIGGLTTIQNARLHRGPGYVWYEDGSEKVPESQYKRDKYATGIMMLGIGLFCWIQWAKVASDQATEAKAAYDSLRAYADWLNAYRNALTAALDDGIRERAVTAAASSREVLDAQAKLPLEIRMGVERSRL